ncbi:Uncharacterised protein [Mycobacteroides abscessus subsp. abscessus]|nr:Uncharacterised protein [Mycobacteroides abscessus subsp. abscessus]
MSPEPKRAFTDAHAVDVNSAHRAVTSPTVRSASANHAANSGSTTANRCICRSSSTWSPSLTANGESAGKHRCTCCTPAASAAPSAPPIIELAANAYSGNLPEESRRSSAYAIIVATGSANPNHRSPNASSTNESANNSRAERGKNTPAGT